MNQEGFPLRKMPKSQYISIPAETENAPARQHLEPIPENPPELSTVSRRRWFSMQGVPCHKAAGMVFSLGVVVTLLVVPEGEFAVLYDTDPATYFKDPILSNGQEHPTIWDNEGIKILYPSGPKSEGFHLPNF
ncbi:hypothetical protein HUJ05_002613 [Dendroctonus ponderosae]|nr:hypothetical protein HUJ05_002613 [Dendroctonus ponderosae]